MSHGKRTKEQLAQELATKERKIEELEAIVKKADRGGRFAWERCSISPNADGSCS